MVRKLSWYEHVWYAVCSLYYDIFDTDKVVKIEDQIAQSICNNSEWTVESQGDTIRIKYKSIVAYVHEKNISYRPHYLLYRVTFDEYTLDHTNSKLRRAVVKKIKRAAAQEHNYIRFLLNKETTGH